MPEGQFQGPKDTYIYVADDNRTYRITRDVTLANIDGVDLVVATVQNSDDFYDISSRITPRGVHWQATEGNLNRRKFLICGSKNAALFVAPNSQPVTVDGVAGVTTGRRGEATRFRKVKNAPAPIVP